MGIRNQSRMLPDIMYVKLSDYLKKHVKGLMAVCSLSSVTPCSVLIKVTSVSGAARNWTRTIGCLCEALAKLRLQLGRGQRNIRLLQHTPCQGGSQSGGQCTAVG